jgi:hypothetical protein
VQVLAALMLWATISSISGRNREADHEAELGKVFCGNTSSAIIVMRGDLRTNSHDRQPKSRWPANGPLCTRRKRKRYCGTHYATRRASSPMVAAANMNSTKVAGSGMAASVGQLSAATLPLPGGSPKYVRHKLGDSDTQLVRINGPLSGAGPLKNVEINDIHSPGADVSTVDLEGLYSLTSDAVLAIDIGQAVSGIEHDLLDAIGTVQLAGHLQLSVLNLGGGVLLPSVGQQFPIIASTGTIVGTFAESTIVTFASGVETHWNVLYSNDSVILEAAEVFAIPGDYNRDNSADAADYVWWRKSLGTSALSADGNQNGEVDANDYDVWQEHFGESVPLASAAFARLGANGTRNDFEVPEPAALTLCLIYTGGLFLAPHFRYRPVSKN